MHETFRKGTSKVGQESQFLQCCYHIQRKFAKWWVEHRDLIDLIDCPSNMETTHCWYPKGVIGKEIYNWKDRLHNIIQRNCTLGGARNKPNFIWNYTMHILYVEHISFISSNEALSFLLLDWNS